jgi:hypothetical protein
MVEAKPPQLTLKGCSVGARHNLVEVIVSFAI